MNSRTEKLIGTNKLNKIKKSIVAVIGLGGVGGIATEALIRSGIENIILVDYDKIDNSNLNRQIISTKDNIGKSKIEEFEIKILKINPNCKITKLEIKLDKQNINKLFDLKFNYLIDCCDTIEVKEEIIKQCLNKKITFISSMGTGNKLDPTLLKIEDIKKTSYDPIAKKIRKYLKDNNIKGKVPVVYSKEQNNKFKGPIPSMIFVPATAGLLCSNYIIKEIIKDS